MPVKSTLGRPPTHEPGTRAPLNTIIDAELKEWLVGYCKQHDLPQNAVIEQALRQYRHQSLRQYLRKSAGTKGAS